MIHLEFGPFADILAALTGVESRLVAVRPAPAWLAVAHRSLGPIGLADAMNAVELLAGLAARYHAGLHLGLGEVLQLVVDVQVLDAAMETGAVLDLPEAESARVNIHRHAWRWRQRQREGRGVYVGEGVRPGPHTNSKHRAGMRVMDGGNFKRMCPSSDCACKKNKNK